MWIVMFVNTALILLLINFRLDDNSRLREIFEVPSQSPVLQGEFADFRPEWYGIVGTAIALSCFTNAVMPFSNFLFWIQKGCSRCMDRGCSCDMRRTSKLIQKEYEDLYMGAIFQFENRYAQLIAMFFIIMMYSAAIPILYLSGFLICLCMYWSDKVLFLRHYRLPPRHGRDLASRMLWYMEYAILLHLFVGCYMLSNETIFSYTREAQSIADKAAKLDSKLGEYVEDTGWFAENVSEWAAAVYNDDTSRFSQTHTKLYISGTFIFCVLFILERFKFVSYLARKLCLCCCLNADDELAFSSNIYSELSGEDKSHEFRAKKDE